MSFSSENITDASNLLQSLTEPFRIEDYDICHTEDFPALNTSGIFSTIKDDPYEKSVIDALSVDVVCGDSTDAIIDKANPFIYQYETEETKDQTMWNQNETVCTQNSPIGRPDRHEFDGDFDFNLEIDGSHTHKKKYLYSYLLNRIYVDRNTNFPIKFTWTPSKLQQDMYVRATLAFADDAQAEKRVEMCHQHSHEATNTPNEMTETERMSVLRSARASGDSSDIFYCGLPKNPNSWYSVVVKLTAPASHAYKFTCKNSCASGINRRATCVIFTLENVFGTVLGRKVVGVRVCSCPRRDKVHDEKGEGRKRPITKPPTPAPAARPVTKKMRVEPVDTTRENMIVCLPPLKIVGAKAAETVLKVALGMMEQKRADRLAAQLPVDDINSSISSIKLYIEDVQKC